MSKYDFYKKFPWQWVQCPVQVPKSSSQTCPPTTGLQATNANPDQSSSPFSGAPGAPGQPPVFLLLEFTKGLKAGPVWWNVRTQGGDPHKAWSFSPGLRLSGLLLPHQRCSYWGQTLKGWLSGQEHRRGLFFCELHMSSLQVSELRPCATFWIH